MVFQMADRLVVAEIDLSAYAHNIGILRSKLSKVTKFMAVVKANAYGHGIVGIAGHAEKVGVDYLGVACLGEARVLRESGIRLPILILNYIDPEGAKEAIDLGVDITVMDEEVLAAVQENKAPAKIHIEIDTGMHRAGISPDLALQFAEKISRIQGPRLEGIFTHFASADETDLAFARRQLRTFQTVIDEIHQHDIHPPLIHAANSAATIVLPESHFSMVRAGVATYGLSPFASDDPNNSIFGNEFLPVLTLKTQIIQIRSIDPGETVGYGRTFKAKRKTKVALLPVGYGDGFRRAPQNWKEVLVHGRRVPILGRVSMDQTSIDVTDIPNVKIHDEVVLLGKQGDEVLSAEEIDKNLGTISYEVVASLAARVSRVYN